MSWFFTIKAPVKVWLDLIDFMVLKTGQSNQTEGVEAPVLMCTDVKASVWGEEADTKQALISLHTRV